MSRINSPRIHLPPTGEAVAWPVEGSTCYYALRHCPKQVRHHIHAARQLIDSVGYCLLEVSEPTVAEKKIHWWHEEIARLADGQPRHPAAKNYLDFFSQLPATEQQQAANSLLTILSCHSEEKFNTMEDQASFEELLVSDGRAKHRLLNLAHLKAADAAATDRASGESKERGHAHAKPIHFIDSEADKEHGIKAVETTAGKQSDDDLLLGLSLFHRLAAFHKLYHAGLPVWPDSLYRQYNLSPESIKQNDSTEKWLNLQSDLFERTIAPLERAQLSSVNSPADNPRQHPDAQLATAIYSAIRVAQLRVWKKNRTNLLQQYRTVTPLKKAWICWRLQRQSRAIK